jgi:hypothetical protein
MEKHAIWAHFMTETDTSSPVWIRTEFQSESYAMCEGSPFPKAMRLRLRMHEVRHKFKHWGNFIFALQYTEVCLRINSDCKRDGGGGIERFKGQSLWKLHWRIIRETFSNIFDDPIIERAITTNTVIYHCLIIISQMQWGANHEQDQHSQITYFPNVLVPKYRSIKFSKQIT